MSRRGGARRGPWALCVVAFACGAAEERAPESEHSAAGEAGAVSGQPGGGAGAPASEGGGSDRPSDGAPAGAGSSEAGAAGAGSDATPEAGAPSVGGSSSGAAGGAAAGRSSSSSGGSAGSLLAPGQFDVRIERASDVSPGAPTTVGILRFAVNLPGMVEARVAYGLDFNYAQSAPVDLAAADHRTLLLGLKPLRNYHVKVVASDGTWTYESPDQVFATGPATTLVHAPRMTVLNPSARERGFLLLSYWNGTGRDVPFVVDADGEVVWWYQSELLGIAHAVLSATGKNLWLVPVRAGGALERLTLDTLDSERYVDTVGSHDITAVTGETMAYIDYGEDDCDSVFEIDPSGVTREIFESQGVLETERCHGNALRYAAQQDVFTFSDRFHDLLGLSRAGEVLWRWTEIVPGGNTAWGGTQHGHQLLDTSLLLFANYGVSKTESAAIEYDSSGNELRRFASGHFTDNLGDVQRLPGGNTLVTFSSAGLVQEFDPDGNVVMELDGDGSYFGYSTWRATLYGDAR